MLPSVSQAPTDPEFVQNPYPFYDRIRKLGPFVFWEDYGVPCTTTFEAANTILRDRRFGREPLKEAVRPVEPRLASFHEVEQHSLLQLEPPGHTRIRRLVLRAFTSRRIIELAPEIKNLCLSLINDFPDGEFDLLDAYATPVPVRVIARLLGVPEELAPDLLLWSNTMVAMYQARRTREIEDAAATAASEFSGFLRRYTRAPELA